MKSRGGVLSVLLAVVLAPFAVAQAGEEPEAEVAAWRAVLGWPEGQRGFWQDGPGWLLGEGERAALLAMDEAARGRWIAGFLGRDPVPDTAENELALGIALRHAVMLSELSSPTDVRARLIFLHGPPSERLPLDCGLVFRPLEIWTWGDPEAPQRAGEVHSLIVYADEASGDWRLWLPQDGKRVLYTREMEHWLEDWEELRGMGLRARRFDLQACREARRVDRVSGVRGLSDADRDRPRGEDFLAFLAPPRDLAAWATIAAGTRPPAPPLAVGGLDVRFPLRDGQRTIARFVVELPSGAAEAAWREAGAAAGGEGALPEDLATAAGVRRELRLVVEGVVESDAAVFETFRVRFRPEAPEAARPVALVLDRPLRPDADYLVRLAVRDEVSGRLGHLAAAFRVPAEARPEDATEEAAAEGTVVARGEELVRETIAGPDHLLLVPPEETVVLGLWRAEALVTGSRIRRVEFLVDGEVQLARSRPPYTAELRLAAIPREQVIGAVGYDAAGKVIAADQVIVNQPRGELAVRIVEPARGVMPSGRTTVRAEVVVPFERRVDRVELLVDDEPVAVLAEPPWQVEIDVPGGDEVVYLTAVAWLDDGSRAEDVRVLNAPGFVEELDVSLVELYVTAVGSDNRLVSGLTEGDFRVLEDGRPQAIRRFEEVRDLPLALGLVIDVSGSMQSSLGDAQRAARRFVESVARPGDVAFVLAFSTRPILTVAPTDDIEVVADGLTGLQAFGGTALHDALVTGLYNLRGDERQKALIVFSDGEDTASRIPFADALEYARRMNVAIYTIGFNVGRLEVLLRRKLDELAAATGGRSFYATAPGELDAVYRQIEDELRSRYLLAYSSDRPRGAEGGDEFRRVAVEVARPGVTGRTIRGYYP